MLVNISKGEECRIAIVEDGKLEEIFFERQSTESHVGNIYKGIISNVEASIQAAFVDFGIGKNGFLHISDLQPQYFPNRQQAPENVGRKISRHDRPPIQRCLKRGDIVIVQVTKEGIGTKGPTLTTYLSIPGRYLVMMPGMSKLGVSRRIEDYEDRQDMRDVLKTLPLPPDMGFILRTAGSGQPKRELQRDLNYLNRLWKSVAKRIKSEATPTVLYQETSLVTRTIRDVLSSDFTQVVIDDAETAEQVRDFTRLVMPRSAKMVKLYDDKEPLFHKYDLEAAIEQIHSKKVPLPSGGSIIIESTEALVAIDVNSGKYREKSDPEATALKIDVEAAEEIARQLRLRDLGGLIICDFIDLQVERNKRHVEKIFRDALKKHKERVQILRMSQFGIIEMTRQRQRPSVQRSHFEDCPQCRGSGLIKSPESLMLDIMRLIQLAIHDDSVDKLTVTLSLNPGVHLLNRKRAELARIEHELNKKIIIQVDEDKAPDDYILEALDTRGQQVNLKKYLPPAVPGSSRS